MRFGIRMPSIKGRISARLSPARYMRHSIGVKAPRGRGWTTSPKRFLSNWIYQRTTFSLSSLFKKGNVMSASPPVPQDNSHRVAHHQSPAFMGTQKKRPLWQRLLFWGVAVPMLSLFWLGVIGAFLSSSKEKTASEPSVEPEPEYANVDRLWTAYDENEVRADQLFKGKRVVVTGIVGDISTGIFGNDAIVHLRGDDRRHKASATMKASAKAAVANFSKGQQVRLLCLGRGKTLGDPRLAECTVD